MNARACVAVGIPPTSIIHSIPEREDEPAAGEQSSSSSVCLSNKLSNKPTSTLVARVYATWGFFVLAPSRYSTVRAACKSVDAVAQSTRRCVRKVKKAYGDVCVCVYDHQLYPSHPARPRPK